MGKGAGFVGLLVVVLIGAVSCSKPVEDGVPSISEKEFDATIKSGVALVDFWATWCPPCREQGPIVGKVLQQVDATVVKIDTDHAPNVSEKYGIELLPTLIIFRDGEPVDRFVGLTSEEELLAAIAKASAEAAPASE